MPLYSIQTTLYAYYFEFYCYFMGKTDNMVAHQYFHKGSLLGFIYFAMDIFQLSGAKGGIQWPHNSLSFWRVKQNPIHIVPYLSILMVFPLDILQFGRVHKMFIKSAVQSILVAKVSHRILQKRILCQIIVQCSALIPHISKETVFGLTMDKGKQPFA